MDIQPECVTDRTTATLDCSALPDLALNWIVTPVITCKNGVCKISGQSSLTNGGGATAPITAVELYLSDDSCLDSSDQILKTKLIKNLKPGKTKKIKHAVSKQLAADLNGKFVIAVVDSLHLVSECNENNNIRKSSSLAP